MIINPYESTSLEAAKLWIEHQPHNKVVGLTSGTFDLFHDFHLRFLLRCRRECDILIVGVDSDKDVRKVKPAPGEAVQSGEDKIRRTQATFSGTYHY